MPDVSEQDLAVVAEQLGRGHQRHSALDPLVAHMVPAGSHPLCHSDHHLAFSESLEVWSFTGGLRPADRPAAGGARRTGLSAATGPLPDA